MVYWQIFLCNSFVLSTLPLLLSFIPVQIYLHFVGDALESLIRECPRICLILCMVDALTGLSNCTGTVQHNTSPI